MAKISANHVTKMAILYRDAWAAAASANMDLEQGDTDDYEHVSALESASDNARAALFDIIAYYEVDHGLRQPEVQ